MPITGTLGAPMKLRAGYPHVMQTRRSATPSPSGPKVGAGGTAPRAA